MPGTGTKFNGRLHVRSNWTRRGLIAPSRRFGALEYSKVDTSAVVGGKWVDTTGGDDRAQQDGGWHFNMDGTSNHADGDILGVDITGTGPLTIFFRVQVDTYDTGTNRCVLSIGTDGGGDPNGGSISIFAEDTALSIGLGGGRYIADGVTMGTTAWHHVAMVVPDSADMSDIYWWIDGVKYTGTLEAGSDQTLDLEDQFLRIGARLTNDRFFDGRIKDLVICQMECTATEYFDWYEHYAWPTRELIEHWKCEEAASTTIYGCVAASNLTASNSWGQSASGQWSWNDETGYSDGPSSSFIPRSETDPGKDATGDPLEYRGRVPRPADASTLSSVDFMDGHTNLSWVNRCRYTVPTAYDSTGSVESLPNEMRLQAGDNRIVLPEISWTLYDSVHEANSMPTPGPFWAFPVYMGDFPDFVSDYGAKWGVYYSTDHHGAAGGIYLSTLDDDGDPRDPDAWTYQGLVFQYTATGSQTETPFCVVREVSGVMTLFLFFHNLSLGNNQSSSYATSTDGTAFTGSGIIYDQENTDGPGRLHNGYLMNPSGTNGTNIYNYPGYEDVLTTLAGGGDNVPFFALFGHEEANFADDPTLIGFYGKDKGRSMVNFASDIANSARQSCLNIQGDQYLGLGGVSAGGSGGAAIPVTPAISAVADDGFTANGITCIAVDDGGSGTPSENGIAQSRVFSRNGRLFATCIATNGANTDNVISVICKKSRGSHLANGYQLGELVPAIPSDYTEQTVDFTADGATLPSWLTYAESNSASSYAIDSDGIHLTGGGNTYYQTIRMTATMVPDNYEFIELYVEGLRQSAGTVRPFVQAFDTAFNSTKTIGPAYTTYNSIAGLLRVLYAGGSTSAAEIEYDWGHGSSDDQANAPRALGIRWWPQEDKLYVLIEGRAEFEDISAYLTGSDTSTGLYFGFGQQANDNDAIYTATKFTMRSKLA